MGLFRETASVLLQFDFFDPTEFVVFLLVFAVLATPVTLVLVALVRRVSDGDGETDDGQTGVERGREREDV